MIDLTIVLNAHQPPLMVNNGPLKSLLSYRQYDKMWWKTDNLNDALDGPRLGELLKRRLRRI